MNNKKIAFIGHRRINIDIRNRLKQAVLNEIFKGARNFSMGTHGDFDKISLDICKEIKNTIKDIKIEVVFTSLNKLNNLDKTYLNNIETIFYEIDDLYFKKQITFSNKQMINSCDLLICYVNPKQENSNAKKLMEYAKKTGKEIINIFDEKDDPTFNLTPKQKKEYYKKLLNKLNKI